MSQHHTCFAVDGIVSVELVDNLYILIMVLCTAFCIRSLAESQHLVDSNSLAELVD